MLSDIPEDEARQLLAIPSICPGADPWVPREKPLFGFDAGAGLIDLDGNPRGLYVEMAVSRGRRSQLPHYRFSVYKTGRPHMARVYQLEVTQLPRLPADKHQWPHEHIGRARNIGNADWLRWSYHDALRHFQAATNITFDPTLSDPNDFRLEG